MCINHVLKDRGKVCARLRASVQLRKELGRAPSLEEVRDKDTHLQSVSGRGCTFTYGDVERAFKKGRIVRGNAIPGVIYHN